MAAISGNTANSTTLIINQRLEDASTIQKHRLGDIVEAGGRRYMYVQAAEALAAQGEALAVDTGFQAWLLTKTLADEGQPSMGVVSVNATSAAVASGSYFWMLQEKPDGGTDVPLQVAGWCAANIVLYTTSTPGLLDDATTSQTAIHGPRLNTANPTAATEANTSWTSERWRTQTY